MDWRGRRTAPAAAGNGAAPNNVPAACFAAFCGPLPQNAAGMTPPQKQKAAAKRVGALPRPAAGAALPPAGPSFLIIIAAHKKHGDDRADRAQEGFL